MTPEEEEEARQHHADQVADLDGRQAREDLSQATILMDRCNAFEHRGGHTRSCDRREFCLCELVTDLVTFYTYDTIDYKAGILVAINLQTDITLDRDATGTPAVWSIRKNDS